MLHRSQSGEQIHTPFRWLPADQTAREALSVTSDDEGKLAWQLDNNTVWMLTEASPSATWVQIGGSSILTTKGDLLTMDDTPALKRLAAGTDGQVAGWNGDGDLVAMDVGGDLALPTIEVLTSGNWTCPAGVTEVEAHVIGGGGGGHISSDVTGQYGGNSGGFSIKRCAVTPSTTYTCTYGAGGTANNTGGTSSFDSFCSATGGGCGQSSAQIGVGSGGDINGYGAKAQNYVNGPTRGPGCPDPLAGQYGCGGKGGETGSATAGTAGAIILVYHQNS